jgi:hypothetical protein
VAEPLGMLRLRSGLSNPTYVTAPPGDFSRLFITQQLGAIRILDLATNQLRASNFLELTGRSGEGLQGLAFHPSYATNGHFYVYTNAAGETRLVRYSRSTADPDRADASSAQPATSMGGQNYGWHDREGSIATPTGGVGGPPPPGNTEPIYDYAHGNGPSSGNAVIGGYVYRGSVLALRGKYFFADFENPRIGSIEHAGGAVTLFENWTSALAPELGSIDQPVSFGEDAAGELYVVDYDGELFRIVGPGPASLPAATRPAYELLAALLALAGAAWLRSRPAPGALPLSR